MPAPARSVLGSRMGGATRAAVRVAFGVALAAACAAPRATAQPGERVDAPADAALRVARRIDRWAARHPEVRPRELATWTHDPAARWSVRPEGRCLAELRSLGVAHRRLPWHPYLVPAPVVLDPQIAGVRFYKRRQRHPLVVACELGVRMTALARVLRAHDVRAVEITSAWRVDPPRSFHRAGLALDITRLHTSRGALTVQGDFVTTPEHPTCEAPLADAPPRAVALRDIACALADSGHLSTVITPNYNEAHRDHFHVDIRPDDPRRFVR